MRAAGIVKGGNPHEDEPHAGGPGGEGGFQGCGARRFPGLMRAKQRSIPPAGADAGEAREAAAKERRKRRLRAPP
ncbi:MAG TPA: hypothetical protein DIT64_10825, partial [Verrucomicrobiales bacterium]|nr:hypothetical protein [Verrucomicrobiales bacterium]